MIGEGITGECGTEEGVTGGGIIAIQFLLVIRLNGEFLVSVIVFWDIFY